jgi:hypothetical protein
MPGLPPSGPCSFYHRCNRGGSVSSSQWLYSSSRDQRRSIGRGRFVVTRRAIATVMWVQTYHMVQNSVANVTPSGNHKPRLAHRYAGSSARDSQLSHRFATGFANRFRVRTCVLSDLQRCWLDLPRVCASHICKVADASAQGGDARP